MTRPGPGSVLLPGPWAHHTVSANGIRLHVTVCGEGPTVVLLHGFGRFWWTWRHQLTGLAAAGFRAVAVDLRGYGASDKPPRGYDLWTLAGDVAGLVPALGEARVHVAGHGVGGLVAWTLAALHPRRVATLAVLSAPHPRALRRSLPRSPVLPVALHMQLPRLPERALRSGRAGQLLREWAAPAWSTTPEAAEAAARYDAALRIPPAAHCAAEYVRWAGRSQLRAEGRRFAAALGRPVEAPVLALAGELDPAVRRTVVEASAPWAGPAFTVETVAGAGHSPHEETPDAVTARLAAWLGTPP